MGRSPIRYSAAALAERFGLTVHGPADIEVGGVGTLAAATADQLAFLSNPRYRPQLQETRAGAVLLCRAVDFLAEAGYEPEFGARPLRRVIQRELDDRIADILVTEAVAEGGTVEVSVSDGELVVAPREERAPLAA